MTGDSAGGGLALALTLYLRDHDMALPMALCLASPWADLTATGESYRTKILTDAIFGSIREDQAPRYPVPIVYAGDHDLTDPYLSPVFGEYYDMPPILLQAGDTELLLSDSVQVAEKMKAAGRDVHCVIHHGMMHTFYVLLPSSSEGKKAWAEVKTFLQERIGNVI